MRALSVAALVPLAEACGGGGGGNPNSPGGGSITQLPVVNGTISGNTVSVTIDASSPIAAVGTAAIVNAGNTALLVSHTAASTFNAMSDICTHQACQITGFANNEFVCTCHGSTYSLTGQVLSGPAPASLPTYPTQFANNVLTIG